MILFFGDPGVSYQENKVSIDGKLLCLSFIVLWTLVKSRI